MAYQNIIRDSRTNGWALASDYGFEGTPTIYVVNVLTWNTSDTTAVSSRNGHPVRVGSLRACLEHYRHSSTSGLIIFETSGIIKPPGGAAEFYRIYKDNPASNRGLCVLGQTAPSPGITIQKICLRTRSGDNTMPYSYWSHIRFEAGSVWDYSADLWDAYRNGSPFTIFDQCSMFWGIDTVLGMGSDFDNVLARNCIIAEGLENAGHSNGGHSKGIHAGPNMDNVWIEGCLLYLNKDRNPYIQGGSKLVANNLVFNWREFPCFVAWSSAPATFLNLVNNYYITGPATVSTVVDYFLRITATQYAGSQIYAVGNRLDNVIQSSASDWAHVRAYNPNDADISGFKVTSEITSCRPTGWTVARSAADTYDYVLQNVGARPVDRHPTDLRIINAVINRTGSSLIDNESEVGGYSTAAVNTTSYDSTMPDATTDSNSDGNTDFEDWAWQLYDTLLPGQENPVESNYISNMSLSTAKTPKAYDDYVDAGNGVFLDRLDPLYALLTVPSNVQGATIIELYAADKGESASSTYVQYDCSVDGTEFVAWDNRVSTPAWISGYSDTGQDLTYNDNTGTITCDIYSRAVSAGTQTVNGAGLSGYLPYLLFFIPGSSPTGGETISSASAAAATKNEGDTIEVTFVWSNNPNQVSGVISFYAGAGPTDLLFESTDGITYTSRVISAGMRTTDLNFKSSELIIPGYLRRDGTDIDPALPASIGNTTVIEAPFDGITIPGNYATFAALIAAYGYLLPDDVIAISSETHENVVITNSGTSGHSIIIDLYGSGFNGTLQIDGDYIELRSTGPCAYVSSALTVNGDNFLSTNINYFGGITDNGSGTDITQCVRRGGRVKGTTGGLKGRGGAGGSRIKG